MVSTNTDDEKYVRKIDSIKDKSNGFEPWVCEQGFPIDISLLKLEPGQTFMRKAQVTPILEEGAKFAWDYQQAKISEQEKTIEELRKSLSEAVTLMTDGVKNMVNLRGRVIWYDKVNKYVEKLEEKSEGGV